MESLNSVKDVVMTAFEENKDKVAVLEVNKKNGNLNEIKYGELKEKILALGTAIYYDENLRNTNIGVIGENSSNWLITYLAVICGAGVIVPLDKELPPNEILNLIKRAKIKMLVYSNKKRETIESIKDKLPKDIKLIQMLEDENKEKCLNDLIAEGRNLINKGKLEYVNKKINTDIMAAIIFTSGTSSNSKGVMLSHKNLIANVNSIRLAYKELLGISFFSFLPIHHTYEFTITYLTVLSSGGKVCISRGIRYLLEDLKMMKPRCMCCVPLLLENIKKKIEKTVKKQGKEKLLNAISGVTGIFGGLKSDIRRSLLKQIHEIFGGNLKYILCGAASLDKATAEYMEKLGFVILQGYGLTEASPLVSGTTIKSRALGTVGRSIPNVEVRIDITDKGECAGEIIVKGDNVMLGYYNDDDETKKTLVKGWLYTGDLGKFDNKGNLVITGRKKNVIVTNNGKNIYPEELEILINKIPLVNESMVYGYIDENKDVIVAVKVTLDEEYLEEKYSNNRPTIKELENMLWEYIKKINHTLNTYKAIKKIEIKKEDFVKTTTLKIKRNEELKK